MRRRITMKLRQLRFPRTWIVPAVLLYLLSLPGCTARPSGSPARTEPVIEVREGLASFYGRGFEGKVTASGTRFRRAEMVAAHPTYPFGTLVRVTNLDNGRSVRVRILDRGPARRARADGVIIDVSQRAAQALGFIEDGRTRVRVEVLRWGATG